MHSTNPSPQIFDFRGNDVRIVPGVDGEPRWIAQDVALILGYDQAVKMTRMLESDEVDRYKVEIMQVNGELAVRSMNCVTESGLYTAIFHSQRPEAVEFRRWVTREVLPSIRKHGGYLTDQKIEDVLADPDTIIALATQLKEERATAHALKEVSERQAAELQSAAPKVEAYDTFLDGDGTYSIGNVAKMLGLSQNKLFDRLRNAGVLITKGAMRNTPYQKYMHHFAVKAYDYERSNGDRATSYTTRVQPSGIDFINRKLGLNGQKELAA